MGAGDRRTTAARERRRQDYTIERRAIVGRPRKNGVERHPGGQIKDDADNLARLLSAMRFQRARLVPNGEKLSDKELRENQDIGSALGRLVLEHKAALKERGELAARNVGITEGMKRAGEMYAATMRKAAMAVDAPRRFPKAQDYGAVIGMSDEEVEEAAGTAPPRQDPISTLSDAQQRIIYQKMIGRKAAMRARLLRDYELLGRTAPRICDRVEPRLIWAVIEMAAIDDVVPPPGRHEILRTGLRILQDFFGIPY